jgi:hypothetical protein
MIGKWFDALNKTITNLPDKYWAPVVVSLAVFAPLLAVMIVIGIAALLGALA